MAVPKFIPHELKTSIIKIISYKEKKLCGYLVNSYFKQEMYFDNLAQFIFLMDNMLNDLSYPQASMESRSFSADECGTRVVLSENTEKNSYALATFKLNVLFRQNASWQGNIMWVENNTEASFRSLLELIMLLDDVLSDAEESLSKARKEDMKAILAEKINEVVGKTEIFKK